MAKIDKINAFGTTYNVAANSNDVAYNGDNVDNVEDAIDELYERTEGGGGGGDTTVVSAAPYYLNGKLPVWKDNMKILFIANSYIQRAFGWELINVLNGINEAYPNDKITGQNLLIKRFFLGGQSMSQLLNVLKGGGQSNWIDTKAMTYTDGTWSLANAYAQLPDVVASEAWDVIILQAFPPVNRVDVTTEQACIYGTFSDTLKEFIYELRKRCANPSLCIGFHMIWPYPATVVNFSMAKYMQIWGEICEATKQMVADSGVDVIIPSGTAMANAVNTNSFNGENTNYLLRDNVHLGLGVAEYIQACTIYEAVLAPVFKKSMYNITAVPDENTGDQGDNTYSQANITVTAENLGLCHEIALRAVSDMYHVDETIDPIQP